MKIERIRIQGYRSLEDVTIHPADLRVLVGPNNAGKSNIVDAIGFLADVYSSGIAVAIKNRDGFDRIIHRRNGTYETQLSFASVLFMEWAEFDAWAYDFDGKTDEKANGAVPAGVQLSHSFTIRGLGEPVVSDFAITDEKLRIELVLTETSRPLLSHLRRGNYVVSDFAEESPYLQRLFRFLSDSNVTMVESFLTNRTDSRTLTLKQIEVAIPLIQRTVSGFANSRIYQIYPNVSRSATPPESEARLARFGMNLPAAIQTLQTTNQKAWTSVEHAMYSVAPQITKITVETTYDRQWILRFEEANGNTWLASEVSDGTLRTLALLVAIFDPETTLLMIEEPENSVHPWMIRTILESCRESIKQNPNRQILLTTHSPVVIDALEPSEILMVWREEGSTHVKPVIELDPDIQRLWENGDMEISSILDTGFLQENVPVLAS